MALINRVSRLFQADFHAVLDRIEEPELLLRHAVHEMEDELNRDEQRSKLLDHETKQLLQRRHNIEQSLISIEEELDICFEADNEELARALIKRKLESQRAVGFLHRREESLGHSLEELNTGIRENRSRLESMRQKADLLAESNKHTANETLFDTTEFSIDKADVEIALLREKQKRSKS
ncbi:MAG: PspA/IM30 family protein [Candidatus Sedimenticola sp. (ex Thyasira tokunagai)]